MKPIDNRRASEYAVYNVRKGQPKDVMSEDQSGPITELLHHWMEGDEEALRALVPLVYKELRRLAHYHLQSSGRTFPNRNGVLPAPLSL